jgi:hypothetical protein
MPLTRHFIRDYYQTITPLQMIAAKVYATGVLMICLHYENTRPESSSDFYNYESLANISEDLTAGQSFLLAPTPYNDNEVGKAGI